MWSTGLRPPGTRGRRRGRARVGARGAVPGPGAGGRDSYLAPTGVPLSTGPLAGRRTAARVSQTLSDLDVPRSRPARRRRDVRRETRRSLVGRAGASHTSPPGLGGGWPRAPENEPEDAGAEPAAPDRGSPGGQSGRGSGRRSGRGWAASAWAPLG